MSDEMGILSAIEGAAADYRKAYRLEPDMPVEAIMPDWFVDEVIEQYGSLETAVPAGITLRRHSDVYGPPEEEEEVDE